MEDARFMRRIQDDIDGALRSGVGGTPTFFINGRLFQPSKSFEELYDAIVSAKAAER
jgi:protein-disulfide isomerase